MSSLHEDDLGLVEGGEDGAERAREGGVSGEVCLSSNTPLEYGCVSQLVFEP